MSFRKRHFSLEKEKVSETRLFRWTSGSYWFPVVNFLRLWSVVDVECNNFALRSV